MDKYSLNQEIFKHGDGKRAYNHIFAMEHVTEETIDYLIEDLRTPGAFPLQNGREVEAAQTGNLGSAYTYMGQYQKAIDLCEEGLKPLSRDWRSASHGKRHKHARYLLLASTRLHKGN